MTEWVLPAATLVAAIGLTYVFCVRPMRAGRCAMTSQAPPDRTGDLDRREAAEIEAARAQLAALRASVAAPVIPRGSGRVLDPHQLQTVGDDTYPPRGGTADAGSDRSG